MLNRKLSSVSSVALSHVTACSYVVTATRIVRVFYGGLTSAVEAHANLLLDATC